LIVNPCVIIVAGSMSSRLPEHRGKKEAHLAWLKVTHLLYQGWQGITPRGIVEVTASIWPEGANVFVA